MNSKPSTLLLLAGIFLVGCGTGAVVTFVSVKRSNDRRFVMEQFAARQLDRLSKALQLSDAQRAQVRKLAHETGEDLGKLRRESWIATNQRIRELNEKIAALLTSEQLPKFEAIQKEQAERAREQMERMRRGSGDGRRQAGPGGEGRSRPDRPRDPAQGPGGGAPPPPPSGPQPDNTPPPPAPGK